MARIIAPARRLVMPVGMTGWQSRWFDGVDDRIVGVQPATLSGSNPFTAVAWVRCSRVVTATATSVFAWGNTAAGNAYVLCGTIAPAGVPYYGIYTSAGQIGARRVDLGWHRLVCTFSGGAGGTMTVYVDGAFTASAAWPAPNVQVPPMLQLGGTGGAYFPGNIWDARIYERAWSLAEVQADYRGEWVDPTGLRRWWKLEDLTAATAHEEIGATDDAVTGALISADAPFRLRRAAEDVSACPLNGYMVVNDHVDLRPQAVAWGWMGWYRKCAGLVPTLHQKNSATTDQFRIGYSSGGGVLRLWIKDAAGFGPFYAWPSYNNGSDGWYHYAASCDVAGNLVSLYVNGSVVGQTGLLGAGSVDPTGTLVITAPGFNDLMWRKGAVFAPEEIRAHYLEGTVPAGLTCHWPCREGAGTNAADIVGGRNGTLAAASWTTNTRCKARGLA